MKGAHRDEICVRCGRPAWAAEESEVPFVLPNGHLVCADCALRHLQPSPESRLRAAFSDDDRRQYEKLCGIEDPSELRSLIRKRLREETGEI